MINWYKERGLFGTIIFTEIGNGPIRLSFYVFLATRLPMPGNGKPANLDSFAMLYMLYQLLKTTWYTLGACTAHWPCCTVNLNTLTFAWPLTKYKGLKKAFWGENRFYATNTVFEKLVVQQRWCNCFFKLRLRWSLWSISNLWCPWAKKRHGRKASILFMVGKECKRTSEKSYAPIDAGHVF